MKAKIFSLMALVLGMVSCQTEPEGLDVIVGGEVDTVVTVTIPEAETRAITSSLGVFNNGILDDPNVTMRYILEIYYGDESRDRLVDYSDGTEVAFPVRLVPDRDYNFVVWADVVTKENDATEFSDDDNHYNTEDLRAITLKDWDAMDETRDAFTGYFNTVKDGDKTPYNGSKAINIPLTRPFAKLRVITTDFDELAKYGIKATSGVVSYSSDYSGRASFDAYEGKASEAITTFLGDSYNIVAYDSEDGGDEHTIFSDYIFASTNGDIVKFDLDIYDLNGGRIKYNNFNTDIRVKRNYITTIKGDVLTTSGKVTVTVNPGFAEDEIIETYVDSADDLQDIINDAQPGEETNIVIGGNIDLGDLLNAGLFSTRASANAGLVIPEGKSVVLDLNGFTISQSKACDASYSMIVNNGQLTITGEGAIEFTNTAEGGGDAWGTYTIDNRSEGVLTIDNATIRHNGCVNGETNHDTNIAIQNYAGKVVINGGIIESTDFRSLRDFTAGGEIIINGGTFLGQVWMQGLGNGSSSLTITGGSFSPVASYDGSSIYITNNTNVVNVAITGGMFNTKVGCFDPNKEGAKGCIVSGSFTATAKENTAATLINDDYAWVEAEGLWTLDRKPDVAKIGEVGYTSLAKAVAAVNDGGTIILVANEVFTENNYYDNGGWKDGLGYAGDKNFTIDLNGYTISQNGALNDYLLWFKNVGSKANTITIKNGTLDAGTTAYCALCTASSHENELTINLENITLTNKKSNGSTIKVRAGSTLNVNAGTKIIGQDSYLGIECAASTVNIYDGAELYMNGKSSYNGCLAGACYGGTINVYGGYGKGVKGGFIAMTSGGTINVSGGEWIANTDGTIGDNSNLYILTAQSNKYESGFVGGAYVNVTGGTLRGGMDAWVLNNIEGEVAELNISGGNFNANPSAYLADGCEATVSNGIWTVRVAPVAKVGDVEYETLEAAVAAAKEGATITLLKDVTLTEELALPAGVTFNGNGKQINGTIYAGGNLTFVGHTKVTAFSASYYNRTITIGAGACLEVTGTGRVTLGYGNIFNITGSVENAKTADKANIQPSLIIPGGISITGGNDATMNVTNAYVKIGSTTSKPGVANGKFAWNFDNAIVEFTKEFGFYDPTGGVNPTFIMNIKDSVFTTGTKIFVTKNSEVNVDNSVITLGSYLANRGELNLINGSAMTGATIQFGENGGNSGTITVDASTFTITASSTGQAFDGKNIGSITASNGAEVSVDYYKAMTITVDETSTFTGTEVK